MKTPPMTHPERTKNIAKVCKRYNDLSKALTHSTHKTKSSLKKLDTFLIQQCKEYKLNIEGIRNILGVKEYIEYKKPKK